MNGVSWTNTSSTKQGSTNPVGAYAELVPQEKNLLKPDNLVAVIGLPVAVVLLRRGRVASDGVDEVARLIGRKFVRVVALVEVDQDLGGAD